MLATCDHKEKMVQGTSCTDCEKDTGCIKCVRHTLAYALPIYVHSTTMQIEEGGDIHAIKNHIVDTLHAKENEIDYTISNDTFVRIKSRNEQLYALSWIASNLGHVMYAIFSTEETMIRAEHILIDKDFALPINTEGGW